MIIFLISHCNYIKHVVTPHLNHLDGSDEGSQHIFMQINKNYP